MADRSLVFADLRKILVEYASHLNVTQDDSTQLYLDTQHMQKNKKPLFFGSVHMQKAYVSYHLMPVYVNPSLLDPVTEQLKARMHGKSCFRFVERDAKLFRELAILTKAGFESYRAQGYI